MPQDIAGNPRKQEFFHGTSLEAAEKIAKQGFRVWFHDDEIGHCPSGGNLGNGVYFTCDWRMALWFGPTLLRIAIRPGTKILNASIRPEDKVIDYLKREFGREILTKPPWKVLPKNKKLRSRELVNLFRYHYRHAWERQNRGKGSRDWPRKREVHQELLRNFRSMLIRHGFHAYGNPTDDNGIVAFAEDRLMLEEVVAHFPETDYWPLHETDFPSLRSIEEARKSLRHHGSSRAKQLADRVARDCVRRPLH